MIKYAIGIAILGALVFAVDQNGYARCKRDQEKAVTAQKIDDVKAVSEIKEKEHERKAETAKQIVVVRKIIDPSGCATATYPVERADRLRALHGS